MLPDGMAGRLRLVKANSYRRPIYRYEGSDKNSHMLVVRLLLLALFLCIAHKKYLLLTDQLFGHCRKGFTHTGWPRMHAFVADQQAHAGSDDAA